MRKKIERLVREYIHSFNMLPTEREFKDKYMDEYKWINENYKIKYNDFLIELGYDPYKISDVKNYGSLSEEEIYGLIKNKIKDFIDRYEYVPNEQIYKTLPLPSLKYLKARFNITYPRLLKNTDCDHINGFKIYKHIPKEVLLRQVKLKIDEYLKNNNKLPNKKAFGRFKVGSVQFYEKRFQKTYYDLLESLGYSLKLKHKPLIYKNYSYDEIFELTRNEIKKFVGEHGVVPTQFQYGKLNAPSEIYFKKRHNLTYNALLLKLGFEPINPGEKYKYFTDEECFIRFKGEIERFAREKNRLPNGEEFQSLDVPSYGYIKKRFKFTYKELIKYLGYSEIDFIEGYLGLKEEEVFEKIKEQIKLYVEKNMRLPTQKQYNSLNGPSSYLIKKLFGLTYNQLVNKLGFNVNRKNN
ncbi:MAG: hypothetical protein N4A57_12610 [Anaeromicrobium sp.]|uniref:hypothetical protein n=1 Tax=Anaeromicrobium sp. TaxID=1929132 RepID=UPI0025F184D9|nr:hypothetical protein [Anaeromicrobium sp.]MCT4595091.1 hypothetical protein [Anaeromicrobium sp.]